MKERAKEIFWKAINVFCLYIVCFGVIILTGLQIFMPTFPILLLFDFCFWVGHPLFLRYVLKKKWFDCTKDEQTKFKYISFPSVFMVVLFSLMQFVSDPQETINALEQLSAKL